MSKSHKVSLDAYLPRTDLQDPWVRWKQPFIDLTLPRTPSDWLGQVAHERAFVYDRIRQFVARLGLAALIAACFTQLDVSWWAWVLLTPALLQGVSEIILEKPVRRTLHQKAPSPGRGFVNWASRIQWRAYGRKTLNVTGQIGAAAAIANVIAVLFGTRATDGTGWLKVAAFTVAMLYVNSGASGPLTEDTVYEKGHWGPALRIGRPFAWPFAVAIAAGLVAWSHAAVLWPSSTLPYTYMVCALPYALGLRIREHDRVANAAGRLVRAANEEKVKYIGLELHNLTSTLVKGPIDRILKLDGIRPADALVLQGFLDDIEHAHTKARRAVSLDQESTLLPSPATVITRKCAAFGIDPRLHIDLPESDDDRRVGERVVEWGYETQLARHVMVALADNAVDAYEQHPEIAEPVVDVFARIEGGDVLVAVSDMLDLVPDDLWNAPIGILAAARTMITVDRDGTLRQTPNDSGGKTIEARWPLTYRDLRQMEWEDAR